MRIRSAGLRFAIPLVALGLVIAGCSSDDNGGPAGSGAVGSTSDINPKDPGELRDGGNLRLAISAFPQTFNALHVDIDGDASSVVAPTLPQSYTVDAAGNFSIDHNYYTDIQLTNTEPQQVTYTINPAAKWSDGSPITWEDLQAQANALSGANKDFLVAANSGFDRVEKVERGVDDRQAIVTFSKHYAEWKGQYGVLYPKSVTATPESFNNSLRDGLPVTAGPFQIGSIDRGQNRITLARNSKWWGPAPRLDTITYSVLDYSAWLPALQNNEVDAIDISSRDDIKTARNSAGVVVRRAPANRFSQLTFNGAEGSILADPKLRVAISKAIDRQGIATAIQTGIVDNPKPLNNHVFLDGQVGFQDNSAPIAYDPEAAAKMLDDLGWKLVGDVREKDGRKLEIKDVMYQQDTWIQMAQIMQNNLGKIGVKLNIETHPGNGLFTDIIDPGNFDVAQFSWEGSALPLIALTQIYAYNPDNLQGNKGRIGSPEINELIERTISELDPDKAIALANEVDLKVFEEGFSIPFVQSPGNVAVRDNLANYGAFGLASADYTKIGFLK